MKENSVFVHFCKEPEESHLDKFSSVVFNNTNCKSVYETTAQQAGHCAAYRFALASVEERLFYYTIRIIGGTTL